MRWQDSRRSDNVEDERGSGSGGGPGLKIGVGGLLALIVAYFLGIDPRTVLSLLEATGSAQQTSDTAAPGPAPTDQQADFVRAVLGETEDVWKEIFHAAGSQYQPPKLVLFSGQVQSACGYAQAASGPFYCPQDQKVYIDLAFYRQLATDFKAPGEFAQAYVLAHEVGHHVQWLRGISDKVRAAQERASPERANQLSVRLELQADCYAGVWANHADHEKHILEQGDVEAGLQAAAAVGDDTLQRRMHGYIVPESFTHGTAAQRAGWFKRGLASGQTQSCDTFSGND
jgi:predicted metalloprotease